MQMTGTEISSIHIYMCIYSVDCILQKYNGTGPTINFGLALLTRVN